MISFNKESVFNLKPIDVKEVIGEVDGLLLEDEEILCAFKTIRDQVVFTDRRIISIDVQGITGRRKSFSTLPYATIQYFTIQTPGFLELIPDSELFLSFSNGYNARFEFKGNVDLGSIGRIISEFALKK